MSTSELGAHQNSVLLLEDNSDDRTKVRKHLTAMGMSVYDTNSAALAKSMFNERNYILVIVHLSNDSLEFLDFFKWVREISTIPMLALTSRDEFIDENMALHAGADDYITKPIELKILTSRINQQIKRGKTELPMGENNLTWKTLSMDISQHTFRIGENLIPITHMEFQFLHLLMEKPDCVFSRKQILDAIGVPKGAGTDHVVDAHVSRIRAKVRAGGGPEVIEVIRSVGFRLATLIENQV
jgi:DNA-binding response OmpR family regulator